MATTKITAQDLTNTDHSEGTYIVGGSIVVKAEAQPSTGMVKITWASGYISHVPARQGYRLPR